MVKDLRGITSLSNILFEHLLKVESKEHYRIEGSICLEISERKTKDLKRKIGAIPKGEWKRFEDEQVELTCELAEIEYKPKSWDHGPYRYIVSRRKRKLKRSGKQRVLLVWIPGMTILLT